MRGFMQDFPLTLLEPFRKAERLYPTREIVTVTADGSRETTNYGEWAERTRRLVGVFGELGLSDDARVGTFAWNNARHLELYFAAPCSGRVLHTLNIRLFPEQLVYVANHAEDEVVFVDRSLLPLFWPQAEQMETVKHFVIMDDGSDEEIPDGDNIHDYEELLAAASPGEFHVADENQAAAMCYTSGTTGNPKGVVYSHRSASLHAMATMLSSTFGLAESDRVLPVVPMFHANAWGLAHAAPLAGAELVLPGPDLKPASIAKLLEEERITISGGVPTIWMGVHDELQGRDTSNLRMLLCGGSAVPKSLSEKYRESFGLPIQQAWGMTETSPLGSFANIKENLADKSEEDKATLRSTIGFEAPFVNLRIADEDGKELPWDGEAQGELQAKGPWIAGGYYDDERSPMTDDGWMSTGDVAVIDAEGYIRLVDRTKDVVKSGGEWISSVELENEIMGDERVSEAAVIGVPDEKWGERPVAYVVANEGEELSPDDVKEYLSGKVAKFWIPSQIEFIDEIPKTSVGKFSKKTLREQFAEEKAEA